MPYYLLCSGVCSLGHCLASWTANLPGSICDVAVRHSHIVIVARGFGTWASACRVLHPVLLHAHNGLVKFPCLWRRGSFPHSLPFYATDTASTLTASWSRWSLVTSVPVAVGFGIWLDWPTPTLLHVAVLGGGGHSVKWGRKRKSLGIRSGIFRSIQARSCFVHDHISSPSPHSMRRWLSVSVLSHFLHASVYTMRILKILTFVWRISWITLYHAALVAPATGASPRFFQTVSQAVCGHKLVIRISLDYVAARHT